MFWPPNEYGPEEDLRWELPDFADYPVYLESPKIDGSARPENSSNADGSREVLLGNSEERKVFFFYLLSVYIYLNNKIF